MKIDLLKYDSLLDALVAAPSEPEAAQDYVTQVRQLIFQVSIDDRFASSDEKKDLKIKKVQAIESFSKNAQELADILEDKTPFAELLWYLLAEGAGEGVKTTQALLADPSLVAKISTPEAAAELCSVLDYLVDKNKMSMVLDILETHQESLLSHTPEQVCWIFSTMVEGGLKSENARVINFISDNHEALAKNTSSFYYLVWRLIVKGSAASVVPLLQQCLTQTIGQPHCLMFFDLIVKALKVAGDSALATSLLKMLEAEGKAVKSHYDDAWVVSVGNSAMTIDVGPIKYFTRA